MLGARTVPNRWTRRRLMGTGFAATAGTALPAMIRPRDGRAIQSTPLAATPSGQPPDPAVIEQIVHDAMKEMGLRAVIYRMVIDGEPVVSSAAGESMTGVPATADMHFRNGAVAIGNISTLLLVLVDEGVVALDDTIDAWLPDLPDANRVTLRMLISMSAGYPDFVPDDYFVQTVMNDPFRQWTASELIDIGLHTLPRSFEPGTNWDYSHTDIVILGQAIEIATGQPLGDLLRTKVLDPLGLTNTVNSSTPVIPEPVLHAFTSERKQFLSIPADTPFYEESTYWNPSWTLAPGSVTTSTITDMTATAIDWGTGSLLSPESHTAQITPFPDGFGSKVQGCRACHPLDANYNYALGLVTSNGWILQNPNFFGISAITAYLPAEKLAIAAAATFDRTGFDDSGNYLHQRAATELLNRLAATVTTDLPMTR